MLDKIKAASQNGLVACFAGVGSAFAWENNESSLILAKNGVTILVDLGSTIPHALHHHGIELNEFDYFHFTHSHGDHAGGVERLLLMSRYVYKKKPRVIITGDYQRILWEHTLKGGAEYNEEGLLRFSDFIEPIRPDWIKAKPREMYEINIEGINLRIFRTKHIPGGVHSWEQAFWSTGLLVDNKLFYTCDTRFDPQIFEDVTNGCHCGIPCCNIKYIFHDCQLFPNAPGTGVHASYEELKTLPTDIKEKMYLHHYGDNFTQFTPEQDGFKGFAEPWKIYDCEHRSSYGS